MIGFLPQPLLDGNTLLSEHSFMSDWRLQSQASSSHLANFLLRPPFSSVDLTTYKAKIPIGVGNQQNSLWFVVVNIIVEEYTLML